MMERLENASVDQHIATIDAMKQMPGDSALFAPFLNGALAKGARVFDLNGNTVDPLASSGPATELFSTINEKARDAIGSLADPSVLPPYNRTSSCVDAD